MFPVSYLVLRDFFFVTTHTKRHTLLTAVVRNVLAARVPGDSLCLSCVTGPTTSHAAPRAGRLLKFLGENAITRMLFTPSLLQLVLDQCDPEALKEGMKTMRIVWLCGEVVTVELR